MAICRTCCMPDTRPDLHFDETGKCSACISVEKKNKIHWESREKELIRLLDKHHGEVIVPSSGGKDSTYQAIRLKDLGANVTAVTARTCHLTPIGRENIDNLARHVRTVEFVPDMSVREKLNRFGLEMVGDISWPEHASIFTTPLRMAAELGISLVMYGECPQAEYGGPQGSEEARQMTRRWISEFGGFLGLRPSDFVGMEGITAKHMADYELPMGIEDKGIEAHFLGAYEEWDSHRNAEVACENGMQSLGRPPSVANWWEWENLDNAQTGIHDFMMYLKYGFGRFTSQISVDVRNGLIDRDVALKLCKVHEGKFPLVYAGVPVEEVLDRIGIDINRLNEIMKCFTNPSVVVN